jgi:hypothetical protein
MSMHNHYAKVSGGGRNPSVSSTHVGRAGERNGRRLALTLALIAGYLIVEIHELHGQVRFSWCHPSNGAEFAGN